MNMKMFLSTMLSLTLILSVSTLTFAEEIDPELEDTNQSDALTQLEESIDSNSYGGIYIREDGTVCVTLTDESIKSKLLKSRAASETELVFETVQYSLKQLEDARDMLYDKREELKISGVGLEPQENGLIVFASELTEEKKQAVLELSPVKNINFTEVTFSYADPAPVTKDRIDEEYDDKSSRSVTTAYGGDSLAMTKGNWFSSLAYGVYYYPNSTWPSTSGTSIRAYITCGHGYTGGVNSNVYIGSGKNNSDTLLGTVVAKRFANGTPLDIMIIKSDLPWGGGVRSGVTGTSVKKVTGWTAPRVGEEIFLNGRTSGPKTGKIKQVGISIDLEDTYNHTTNSYKNLYTYDVCPQIGDSGTAILVHDTDYNRYYLSGINVGQAVDKNGNITWGCASPWDEIKKTYNMMFRNR